MNPPLLQKRERKHRSEVKATDKGEFQLGEYAHPPSISRHFLFFTSDCPFSALRRRREGEGRVIVAHSTHFPTENEKQLLLKYLYYLTLMYCSMDRLLIVIKWSIWIYTVSCFFSLWMWACDSYLSSFSVGRSKRGSFAFFCSTLYVARNTTLVIIFALQNRND